LQSGRSSEGSHVSNPDGEGTLFLVVTLVSGTCLLNDFAFDTALALPNAKPTPIATLVKMDTISVQVDTKNQTTVMLEGDAHLL
jgi:hypothetical protein